MGRETVKVTIINRNYPPGVGITGESAMELAAFLIAQDIEVNIIHVAASYKGGAHNQEFVGNVQKVKTFYNGKNKIFRLLANLYEGYSLIRRSNRLEADVVICMTDPPLLSFWASLLIKKSQPWVLWAMDIYPEAFLAGKLVSSKNKLYRYINYIIRKTPPNRIIALGEYQAKYLHRKLGNDIPTFILPCGIYSHDDSAETTPQWAIDKSKIYIGYCGNLGEAHSVDFLFSVINHLETSRFHLILSLYGNKADEVLAYAKNKKGITILQGVKRAQLHFIDIHLASLVKEWVNICVPSKSVSSICAGASFLYNGIELSDNWGLLKDAGWMINPEQMDAQVQQFFSTIDTAEIIAKKQKALLIKAKLLSMKDLAFEQLYHYISNVKLPS